jgi:hypothetical protein
VFWWFERSGHYLRYEARETPGGGYELRIIDTDGTERVETFERSEDLSKRQLDFEHELTEDGWNGPHGWLL